MSIVRVCDRCGTAVQQGDLVERVRAVGTTQVVEHFCAGCATATRSREWDDALREVLAAYAHEAWVGWMQYLSDKHAIYSAKREDAERWARQMRTPYAELPEAEKASDRAQADRILAVLRGEGA